MYIDTHCHLDAAEFGGAQDALVSEALAAGVSRMVLPGVDVASFSAIRALCAKHAPCAAAYGIHPLYAAQAGPDDLSMLEEFIQYNQCVAIGEIGLDFFVADYDQAAQEACFAAQLKLAQEFNLPALLHIRKAQDSVLKQLRRIPLCGGIAHAFSGSRQQAGEFIKLGFKLGFGGAMTYPRATRLRELAATLPLDSIVLETDAPDIPPEFLPRGQPNRPALLPRIAETLAELRGLPLAQIAAITSANARAALPGLRQREPRGL